MHQQNASVPHVLDRSLTDTPNWLESFAWPTNPLDDLEIVNRVMRRFLKFLPTCEPAEQRVALLGRGLGEAAIIIEAAGLSRAPEPIQGNRALSWLQSEEHLAEERTEVLATMLSPFSAQPPAGAGWRQIARVQSWSGPARLLFSLIAPQAIAITHNPLLVAHAATLPERVSFRHADLVFSRAMATPSNRKNSIDPDWVNDLSARLAKALLQDERMPADARAATLSLLEAMYQTLLLDAAETLNSLAQAKALPDVLWSGNGGYYPSRALGLEVMRRGGTVRRYDHGGTVSLLACPDFVVQQELAVSTQFVVPTELAARLPVIQDAAQTRSISNKVSILAANGDPSLRPPASKPSLARKRPRVMFVGTAYYGFVQTFPPFPAAPVYLDWQHRILRQLGGLDIDLLHKPHPGGLYKGKPPGLASVAPVEDRLFESAMEEVDTLVFDIAASTTFSIALSSTKNILLLDIGSLKFQEAVKSAISQRCKVLAVGVDQRNRLYVDDEALKAAVCGAFPTPDPSFFRQLFLGEG